ncbi:MAG: hypothetical protein A3K09_06370 [Nitrospinae bacterium RIFCSPLOWO2_12_FULL_47_7]|nr:MAG: hypothetical protein A3K09_06370 [Nitrospinae bacterium RIFCSPLOWO2_12_FULL_47_7]
MAETLGSLVDKISIKNLRLWHLDEMIEADGKDTGQLKEKRDLVARQQQDLANEIDAFLIAAYQGKVKIRDEKVKLYQNRNVAASDGITSMGQAVSELSSRNIRLWHLEDRVRRTDLTDAEIVACKKQIDTSNQERNDLMDKIDEILEKQVGTAHR